MPWESLCPCFSKTPLSLSPAFFSHNTCVHVLALRPRSRPRSFLALVWLVYPEASWFSHSHSWNSFTRPGQGRRAAGKILDCSFHQLSPSDFRLDPQAKGSPPAKSLLSAQPGTMNRMTLPLPSPPCRRLYAWAPSLMACKWSGESVYVDVNFCGSTCWDFRQQLWQSGVTTGIAIPTAQFHLQVKLFTVVGLVSTEDWCAFGGRSLCGPQSPAL